MKRYIISIVIVIIATVSIIGVVIAEGNDQAQSGEMDKCIEMVKKLQNGNDECRQEILAYLKEDNEWTLLDDIGNPSIDEDKRYMSLGLNALAYEAALSKLKKHASPRGVYVHGTNLDYSICFIEKSISAGSDVTYKLEKRKGSEKAAIVEMTDGDLDVWMNGKKIEPTESVFQSEFRNGNITIRLRNRRGYAVSFVIINQH